MQRGEIGAGDPAERRGNGRRKRESERGPVDAGIEAMTRRGFGVRKGRKLVNTALFKGFADRFRSVPTEIENND